LVSPEIRSFSAALYDALRRGDSDRRRRGDALRSVDVGRDLGELAADQPHGVRRPAGVLRLSLPRIGYELVFAPRLRAFLAAYPDIDLDLGIDDGFVDIVAHGFDAGIRIGEMVEREMIGVRVGDELRMAVVAAPAYFAARGKRKHPRDLHAHDCINYRRRTLGVVYRWEFTEHGRTSRSR